MVFVGVLFLGPAAFIPAKPVAGLAPLSMIGVACAVVATVLAVRLRRSALASWVAEDDFQGQDWQAFRRRHLVIFGVLLAAVFFCVFVVEKTGRKEPAYAAVLPLATMLLNLPRRDEV